MYHGENSDPLLFFSSTRERGSEPRSGSACCSDHQPAQLSSLIRSAHRERERDVSTEVCTVLSVQSKKCDVIQGRSVGPTVGHVREGGPGLSHRRQNAGRRTTTSTAHSMSDSTPLVSVRPPRFLYFVFRTRVPPRFLALPPPSLPPSFLFLAVSAPFPFSSSHSSLSSFFSSPSPMFG